MEQFNDNPQQGNRAGQESGENNLHQSQRNQDSQRHETHPDAEKVEKDSGEKFSPGEDPDYNADEFSTD